VELSKNIPQEKEKKGENRGLVQCILREVFKNTVVAGEEVADLRRGENGLGVIEKSFSVASIQNVSYKSK
jgi:hypothetical protein